MTCRKDVEESWNQKILEEIVLVCSTQKVIFEAYRDVRRLSRVIGGELEILVNKMILSEALFKLASTSDDQDPLREERLQELNGGIQKIWESVEGFLSKANVADGQFITEVARWKIIEDVKSIDELKRMKAEERRGLLEKNATCLSLLNSGKEWFENFQDEWDDVKCELDESVLGLLKDLVVIAKEPVEPS